MTYSAPGSAFGAAAASPRGNAPLVLLFERDDAMAVPLLSQLRLAGYDVRAARTPVDLFDAAQKHAVALIVVDLGNAAARRREFWVALDAQRRGRATQVLTFRVVTPNSPLIGEVDAAPHALADLEVGGPQEVPLLVDAVIRRIPPDAGHLESYSPYSQRMGMGLPGNPAIGAPAGASPSGPSLPSPFASPVPANPFSATDANSPFDQPDARNPFAQTQPRAQPASGDVAPANISGSPVAPHAAGMTWTPPDVSGGAGSFAHIPALSAPPITSQGRASSFGPGTNGHADPTLREPGLGPSNGGGYSPQFASEGTDAYFPPYAPPAPVADAWMPPDGVPPLDVPSEGTVGPHARAAGGTESASEAAGEPRPFGNGHQYTDHHANPTSPPLPADNLPQAERSTAPVAVRKTVSVGGALVRPEERALGAVLVEGALISPERLEVLAEIRHMLTTVEVDIRLGELALLFRFLSPDQLLAALLVSRRLITPEQIAALGRIKQEMGASGINYDLETLLVMFNIMSREDLERLRGELV